MIKNIMSKREHFKESHTIQTTTRQPLMEVQGRTLEKPKYSYNSLILMAISNHPRKMMTLNDIYEYIMEKFPYYRDHKQDWKNSIRHNLSISKYFEKIPRSFNEPGKGHYWALTSEGRNLVIGEDTGKLRKVAQENSEPFRPAQPVYYQHQQHNQQQHRPQNGFYNNYSNSNYNLHHPVHQAQRDYYFYHHQAMLAQENINRHQYYNMPYHHQPPLYPPGQHPYY